jgi:hypothetical protein
MANTDDKPVMKITLEDLAKVTVSSDAQSGAGGAAAVVGTRQYGNIAEPAGSAVAVVEEKGSILLKGWFYLGAAGLLGSLIGWGIGEPFFKDAPERTPGDLLRVLIIIPLVLVFMCLGFSIAESIAERSLRKALQRSAVGLPLAAVLSVVFMIGGGLVYSIGKEFCMAMGIDLRNPDAYKNPALWIARGFAWMVFASAAGIVYGLVDRSVKKGRYGVIGAILGGGVGGVLFDPISIMTRSGGPSRAVGFGLIGLATGIAIGIVESALKDRWLYVASGPLAGKQFILYKPLTTIGSSQQCDIYLFKDNTILPQHGSIEVRGAQTFLRAAGQVYVSGQPVRSRALQSGDLVQIGRYMFHFRERSRN